jgi:hypothetical protein
LAQVKSAEAAIAHIVAFIIPVFAMLNLRARAFQLGFAASLYQAQMGAASMESNS